MTASMRDELAATQHCPHPYCAGERWCKLNTAVGLPDDIPACNCAYPADKIEHDWHERSCAFVVALLALLPEPPDGTRIEFEHWTDLHAAWRDNDSSRRTGWPFGDGGATWLMYGEEIPISWARMIAEYGPEPLRLAVRLLVHPDDVGKHERWPTEVAYRALARVEIDPNVRLIDNGTAVNQEDAPSVEEGDEVILFESEEGIEWDGKCQRIDHGRGIVYFTVDWESVRPMAITSIVAAVL